MHDTVTPTAAQQGQLMVLNFGSFNLPDATLPAGAIGDQIQERISDELASAGYDLDVLTLRFTSGGQAVEVLDSDEFPLGTVTISQPEPDYWLTLAEDLHRAAVRVAGLAGTQPTPSRVDLTFLVSVSGRAADRTVPVVDAIAAAFGGTAGPDERNTFQYSARLQLGAVHVHPYTFVPDRAESELERLRAEVAELRAAQGGAKPEPSKSSAEQLARLVPQPVQGPWKCPGCWHEAEHLLDGGCIAQLNSVRRTGRCGCKHFAGGAR